jgi:tetraacyldisaccharide 4'-kinase
VNPELEQNIRAIMSGTARGAESVLLRAALRIGELFYASAIRFRNGMFDRGVCRIRRLARPVISIGNLTTGGTGKSPTVRWLAERLRADGRHVAILSRGYRAASSGLGDELTMLDRSLNDSTEPAVRVRANPDRFAAGESLLNEHPEIDVFLLDDGFQHRRLARDLDIVLVSATEPFGFDHVLPRGLLREPVTGLRRADAVIVTHADQTGADALTEIERTIRRHRPEMPVYRATHAQVGLLESSASSPGADIKHPIGTLADRRFFAFCGLGNPDAFGQQLNRFGDRYAGHRWFADHHRYTQSDLHILAREAVSHGADVMVTTEKDWVKIAPLFDPAGMPIWRIEMRLQFQANGEEQLLNLIRSRLRPAQ